MNYCSSYCGLACVDGSCPKNQDRRYDCFECWLYAGCADCVFSDDCDLPRPLQPFRQA